MHGLGENIVGKGLCVIRVASELIVSSITQSGLDGSEAHGAPCVTARVLT